MYLITGRGRGAGTKKQHAHTDTTENQSIDEASTDNYQGDNGHHTATDDDLEPGELDDPGLLSELEALRKEMGLPAPPVSVPAARTEAASANNNRLDAEAQNPVKSDRYENDNSSIDDVKVTEEDMNDPTLLAELSRFSNSGKADTTEQNIQPKTPLRPHTPEPQPETSLNSSTPLDSESEPKPESDSEPIAVDHDLLRALSESHAELKQATLAAKRRGDMVMARDMLVQMKEVQAAIRTIETGRALPQGFIMPSKPTTIEPTTGSVSAGARKMSGISTSALASDYASPKTSGVTTTPQNMDMHANMRAGGATQAVTLPREIASDVGQGLDEVATSISAMKQHLTAQVAEAARLAAHFLKIGVKAQALEFHRLRKQATADLATVQSYEANGRTLPPAFLHREVQWTAPVEQRRDIGAGQLQVAVLRVTSDGDLAATLGGRSDFYVQWELAWPRDRKTRGYTRTVKYRDFDASGGAVDIDYIHNADVVDRQNMRPMLRWVDRAKLIVELYKYAGLLWGSQLIGRATLPLAALRSQSEAAGVVEIKAGADSLSRAGRPLPGGPVFVDVAVRLRLPLSNKPEIATRSERWIYIDMQQEIQKSVPQGPVPQGIQGLAPQLQEAEPRKLQGPEPQPKEPELYNSLQQQPDTQHKSVPVLPKNSDQKEKASLPLQQQSQPEPSPADAVSPVDEIAAQMDAVDGLVSNAVLELELQQIPSRISAVGRDKDAAERLQDVGAAIKLRMSVVAAQVGAGLLSIQAYMEAVETEAAQAKQWALSAKRAGRKDIAVRAMQRVKAMQTELEQMKAAMDAEDE
ncbi:hypothetical protein COEREDRAFT_87928 [Coemansia reversa NRRL 1564]|uniref:DM14 domain-containing protein n=1 Tax=Coemansia reversa (strain ATCC 12441 / NRRL 1564) TaxID=763665 RepID=A0A2G5B8H6_COERN|nr:hypothetical protein COEREDRAFT_87928 [Coemansia reversa NRRL 1564]|eukprot:PIA15309.1 hypothetical protein COEREDRAFT_87928 [Coemansia reversa NRRL 1564]